MTTTAETKATATKPTGVASPAAAAASAAAVAAPLKVKGKHHTIYFSSSLSTRGVVLTGAEAAGYTIAHKPERAEVLWLECAPSPDEARASVQPHQKVNFVPCFDELCHKCEFGQLMNRMTRLFPTEFDFVPQTFSLPSELQVLQAFDEQLRSKNKNDDDDAAMIWIVKPNVGSHGDGMYLTDNITDRKHTECVFQKYIARPLLLGRFKFDLRIYVLVTSLQGSMRYYVCREGLARLAVVPYTDPECEYDEKTGKVLSRKKLSRDKYLSEMKKTFRFFGQHLTNYTLTKNSNDFVENTAADDPNSSKRLLSTAFTQLAEQHRGVFNEPAFWKSVDEIVVKTLAAVQPYLLCDAGVAGDASQSFAASECTYIPNCFQLLGFDIFLDAGARPWLLEINSRPSLQVDAPVDAAVKQTVADALVRMVALGRGVSAVASSASASSQQPKAAAPRGSRTKATTAAAAAAAAPATAAAARVWHPQDTKEDTIAEFYNFASVGSQPESIVAHQRFAAPLVAAKDLFLRANGGALSRKCGEMSGVRFQRLLRGCGAVGLSSSPTTTTSAGSATTKLTSTDADLMFVRATARTGLTVLYFSDFLDLILVGKLGDVLSPGTAPGSLQRLRSVVEVLSIR